MFGLGTFAIGEDVFAGLVRDDTVVDLRRHLGQQVSTAALLARWDESVEHLAAIAGQAPDGSERPLADLRPLPPVSPAGQIFCAGANYYQHIVEMALTILRSNPDETRSEGELHALARASAERAATSGQPYVFSAATSALAGANDEITLWGPGTEHDWELEVAIVIGRHAHCVEPSDALQYVAGYTICNDISTRDVMFRPGFKLSDIVMSKNRPTFFPIGPYIVPRRFVPDYRALKLTLTVNGEPMQDATVDDIIHDFEALVSYVSHTAELFPGDVILTGSPAGNAGANGNRWLKPGDVIDAQISGLGTQHNLCVPDPRRPR